MCIFFAIWVQSVGVGVGVGWTIGHEHVIEVVNVT